MRNNLDYDIKITLTTFFIVIILSIMISFSSPFIRRMQINKVKEVQPRSIRSPTSPLTMVLVITPQRY